MDNCKYQDLVEDVKKDLYGNGRKGIKADVIILKTQLKVLLWASSIIIIQLSGIIIYFMKK